MKKLGWKLLIVAAVVAALAVGFALDRTGEPAPQAQLATQADAQETAPQTGEKTEPMAQPAQTTQTQPETGAAQEPETGASAEPEDETDVETTAGATAVVQPAVPAQENAAQPDEDAPQPPAEPATEPAQPAAQPEEEQAPEEEAPEEAPEEEAANSCTFSISCQTALENGVDAAIAAYLPADGWILPATAAECYEGETVFQVLQRVCRAAAIPMEFSTTPLYGSAYIEGIGNLYELDCGGLSGWMYRVNGSFPQFGCSSYVLQPGDVVEWVYTCDLGADVGGAGAAEGQWQ